MRDDGSLNPIYWSLARPRSRQLPSCVTAYPGGARSPVFTKAGRNDRAQDYSYGAVWEGALGRGRGREMGDGRWKIGEGSRDGDWR